MRKIVFLLVLMIGWIWPPGFATTGDLQTETSFTVSDDTPEATLQEMATVTPAELSFPLLFEYSITPGTLQDKPGLLDENYVLCPLIERKPEPRLPVDNTARDWV